MDNRLAARAWKLQQQGVRGKAAGLDLKVTTDEANRLAAVGCRLAEVDAARLSPGEVPLIRSIATVTRRNLEGGITRLPRHDDVACVARKGTSWPAATARKRIDNGTGCRGANAESAIGLVNMTGNGFFALTALGWMFVNAIESAEESVRRSLADGAGHG